MTMTTTMMRIEACAKVNLTLEVLGERSDGYHALRSVVLPISLADTLTVEATGDGAFSSDSGFPDDLTVKAARALDAACPDGASGRRGARILIEKRIPVGGGLGGGSADAAATLVALNELWRTGLDVAALASVGAAVGSDVPALVLGHAGGAVLMEGRGETVSRLEVPTDFFSVVLVNPGVFSSTREVYARCRARDEGAPSATAAAVEALRARDLAALAAALANDLEPPALALHPEIAAVRDALRAEGAEGVMMSGSGSTVFALATDSAAADELAGRMRARGYAGVCVCCSNK